MKRTIALMLVAALATMLIAPAAALSAPKGHGAGKGKGASVSSQAGRGSGGVNRSSETSKQAEKAEAKAAKKEAKQEAKAARQEAKRRAGSEVESDTAETSDTPEGDETSVTVDVPQKLTGIANALAHIQANLARMQAKVDAGLRAALPPGLVSVADKFMAWLGITPDNPPVSGGETTDTVEPTDTVQPTDTVLPTDTVVPTDTVDTAQ